MIGQALAWWACTTLLGLVALPLAWRVFSRLPDRGFGFSRALGILGTGYVLWIGASTGVLNNNLGGILGAMVLAVAVALVSASGRMKELLLWLRENWQTVLTMEILYLVAFGGWAFVRANNPEIGGTEKPMELAFLNSILRSERFPPPDPWLSGYAISYYYLGYVLLAMLARLSGVSAGVAYNLGNASWFALTALGTYAILFNLLTSRDGRPRLGAALLGPVFTLVAGNIEGFLEVLHSLRAFWRPDPQGGLSSGFWTWLGIKDLISPPLAAPQVMPERYLWWWRASRVVHDVNAAGVDIEVIDEFPFFSYLLADNHPHLLAMPFVLMAVGCALNIFLARKQGELRLGDVRLGEQAILRIAYLGIGLVAVLGGLRGVARLAASPEGALEVFLRTIVFGPVAFLLLLSFVLLALGALPSALAKEEFWLAAWLFGALAFLNTWDFPIYITLVLAAAIWRARDGQLKGVLLRVLLTGLGVAVAGVLLFLPWYPSFSSQAGGILPNLIFPSSFPQFLVMFATSFVPLLMWLILRMGWSGWRTEGLTTLGIIIGLPIGLLLMSWGLALLISEILSRDPQGLQDVLSGLGLADAGQLVPTILKRRLLQPWTAIVLSGVTAVSVALLRRQARPGHRPGKPESPWPFVVFLIGVGALLVLAPEFVYLKDTFGNRMNTVFKFYFAAWILWGLAAAYSLTELKVNRPALSALLTAVAIVPLLLGMVYPVLATITKTNSFNPAGGRTLDGIAHLARDDPQDYEAILWLNEHLPVGIIAEATGGSYSVYGRISAHTGFPTVLGWDFHELQWRGTFDVQGTRREDLKTLYQTRDWTQAVAILDKYGIDYVYIGPLETTSFGPVQERKFQLYMDTVYQKDGVTIYARTGEGS